MRTFSLVAFVLALILAGLVFNARSSLNAYFAFGGIGGIVALVGASMALWSDDKNSGMFKTGVVVLLGGILSACYAVFFLGR